MAMTQSQIKEERKWEVERALRTIREAGIVKQDKALMKEVEVLAKKEREALNEVLKTFIKK